MKSKIWFFFFPFFLFFPFAAAQKKSPDIISSTVSSLNTVKIRLTGGDLEGRRIKTEAGNEGLVFLGVPFAESPIGDLRFSDPKPKNPWNGIWPAIEYPPVCPQNATASTFKSWNEMSENCLFLNIFAPVDQNQR
jgi:carboxylesterase type B